MIQGTRDATTQLREQLLTQFPTFVECSSPTEARKGFADRTPLRQGPVVEFCISVAEHVVALGVFALIKEVITEAQERDHLIVLSGLSEAPHNSGSEDRDT